jgi:cyanate permease
MLGPMISATVLSPALGGWRHVMYFYGAISVLVGVLWAFFGRETERLVSPSESGGVPLRQALSRLIRLKALWFLGLTMLFRVGCLMGMTGYLPLYLLDKGWTEVSADGTLATFYAVSTLCVVPLAYLSDRLGSRKAILYPAVLTGIVGVGLLPFVDGAAVWVLIIIAGISMDGFMSIVSTMLLETEGVGPVSSGTAIGIVFTIVHIGSVSSPPLGNSLAAISPGTPFLFWASLSVVALAVLFFVRETGRRR